MKYFLGIYLIFCVVVMLMLGLFVTQAHAETPLTEPIVIDPNMILKPGINVGPLKGWMIVKINNTCIPNMPNACWGLVPIYAPPEQYPWWNYSLTSPLVP